MNSALMSVVIWQELWGLCVLPIKGGSRLFAANLNYCVVMVAFVAFGLRLVRSQRNINAMRLIQALSIPWLAPLSSQNTHEYTRETANETSNVHDQITSLYVANIKKMKCLLTRQCLKHQTSKLNERMKIASVVSSVAAWDLIQQLDLCTVRFGGVTLKDCGC